jgi:hypothetical protein
MIKHIGMLLLAVGVGGFCLALGHKVGVPGMGGFVTPAEAIVDRPLTPLSVAAVARRTASICSTYGPPPEGAEPASVAGQTTTGRVSYYYC